MLSLSNLLATYLPNFAITINNACTSCSHTQECSCSNTSENRMTKKATMSLFSTAFNDMNSPPPKANFLLHHLWLQGVWKALYTSYTQSLSERKRIFSFFLKVRQDSSPGTENQLNIQNYDREQEVKIFVKNKRMLAIESTAQGHTPVTDKANTTKYMFFRPLCIQSNFKTD